MFSVSRSIRIELIECQGIALWNDYCTSAIFPVVAARDGLRAFDPSSFSISILTIEQAQGGAGYVRPLLLFAILNSSLPSGHAISNRHHFSARHTHTHDDPTESPQPTTST